MFHARIQLRTCRRIDCKSSSLFFLGNLMDDLMSLNFNDGPPPAWAAAGSISLGQSISPSGSSMHSASSSSAAPPGYSAFMNLGNPSSGSGSGSPAFANSPLMDQNIFGQSSRPSTPASQAPFSQPPATAVDSAFGDFDFVSNTGATPSGSKNGKGSSLHLVYFKNTLFLFLAG